jgi:hypothetical protein
MRRVYIAATTAGLAALIGGWLALGAAGQDRAADLPPLPTHTDPHVVQPVAGNATPPPSTAVAPDPGLTHADAAPTVPATKDLSGKHVGIGGNNAVTQAIALGNGVALPPLDAPEAVKQIIEAGNGIARTPYIWGGGHGKWLDKGYDCSGSVSFALAGAGLLDRPLVAADFMRWGDPGPGRWITIYANAGHTFMVVAGLRFDTSGAQGGTRWQAENSRSYGGFVARHPPGL